MSNNYKHTNDRYRNDYTTKNQIFWKVFGVGADVKLMTASLPAGMGYDLRLQTMQGIDRKIKELGGKVLKSGFWTTPVIYPEPDELPEPEISDALPF